MAETTRRRYAGKTTTTVQVRAWDDPGPDHDFDPDRPTVCRERRFPNPGMARHWAERIAHVEAGTCRYVDVNLTVEHWNSTEFDDDTHGQVLDATHTTTARQYGHWRHDLARMYWDPMEEHTE